jgi:hypothetical protein
MKIFYRTNPFVPRISEGVIEGGVTPFPRLRHGLPQWHHGVGWAIGLPVRRPSLGRDSL